MTLVRGHDEPLAAGERPPRLEREKLADRLAARLDERSALRERREEHFLRYLPLHSPLHSLWAGTKFIAVSAISIAIFVWPNWPALGVLGGLLILALLLVRVPRSAVPRIPPLVYVILLVWAGISTLAGGRPLVVLGGVHLWLGGVLTWLRFLVLALELLTASSLIGWTTPLAELAPALSRLGAPLKKLRVPVDELAVALALSIRCLPLVVEELRTLRDARRARRPRTPRTAADMGQDALELVVATLLGALRRASELADAIEARGGATVIRHDGRAPKWRDWVALALVAGVIVGMGLLS